MVGHLAEDQIGLVVRGAANHHVGILRASLAQHRRLDAVAHHAAQIKALAQLAQSGGVGVDHGDVVLLQRQAFGDAFTDTARAENNDVHGAK